MRTLLAFSVALAISATTVHPAFAAPAAGPEAEAERLIANGLELRRAEKPVEALELFQRAHGLAPTPRTLGQMGLVEAALERWADAEVHLLEALATPDDAWVRKNRSFL